MQAHSASEIQKIYNLIDGVKRLSDRIIGIGPLNIIGLDGLLALIPIPILSTVYSVGASSVILFQAIRARASLSTLTTSFLILLIDAGLTTVEDVVKLIPGVGFIAGFLPGTVDAFFQGHLYAAHLVQKEINQTIFHEESASDAKSSGRFRDHLSEMKSTKGKNRVVYLLP